MKTLLEIGDDLNALLVLIEECDGELTPDVEAALDGWFAELGEARDEKLDNYCALIRECELRAVARKAEVERLQMRVKADQNLAERLRDRLKYFMDSSGQGKIETQRYTLSVQANGGKVPVEITGQPEDLPEMYQRKTISADADLIRHALELGVNVPGCVLGVRGRHLRIK